MIQVLGPLGPLVLALYIYKGITLNETLLGDLVRLEYLLYLIRIIIPPLIRVELHFAPYLHTFT